MTAQVIDIRQARRARLAVVAAQAASDPSLPQPRFSVGDRVIIVMGGVPSPPIVIQGREFHYPAIGAQPFWRYRVVLKGRSQFINEKHVEAS